MSHKQLILTSPSFGRVDQAIIIEESYNVCYFRRNEQVIGSKIAINRQPGAVTVVGDDPKKFAAAMVEYSRDKVKIVFIIY